METYPLLESLTVQFEQPTKAHSTILELKFFYVRSDVTLCAQAFNMASKVVNVQTVLVRSFLLLQCG